MHPDLPILNLPPVGWSYKQHIALVGQDTVIILTMEKDPEPPSILNQFQEELGIGTSDGILGIVLTLVVFWNKISPLFSKIRKGSSDG